MKLYELKTWDARFVGMLVAIAAAALLFVGCGGNDPLADIVNPEPSPSPTAVATPDTKCVPDSGLIQATKKGAPNVPVYSWNQGTEIRLHHRLFNSAGEVIGADCNVSLRTDWNIRGDAYCVAYGSVETADIVAVCQGAGDAYVDAIRAGKEASAVFRVFASEEALAVYNRLLGEGVSEAEAYSRAKGIK